MEIIFKYIWVMFIAFTVLNGIVLKIRSKKYIVQNPELEDGYHKLYKGWLIYGNIPWAIIGIGNITGITKGIGEYFNPKLMNPMVLMFHLSIVVLWILGSNWIYFRGGSEFLASHPGLIQINGPGFRKDLTSGKAIKIFWTLCLLGGIGGICMMWMMDFSDLV